MSTSSDLVLRMAARFNGPWLASPATIYILCIFALPVSFLLGISLFDQGHASLANYQRLFGQALYLQLLGITLKIALWTTVLAILAGYPVALLLSKIKAWRGAILLLVLMPFWTSFLVRAFAWMVLLGRRGAINQWLEGLGIIDRALPLMFNMTGVLIGMVHAMMPIAIMTMLPVMMAVDKRLPMAATTLGAKRGSTFWLVWFPMTFPGVVAAAILVFITSLGFFITPALLGSEQETVIVQEVIFQIQQQLNWGFAGAIGVLVMIAVFVILGLYSFVFGAFAPEIGSRISGGTSKRAFGRAGFGVLKLLAYVTDLADTILVRNLIRPKRSRGADAIGADHAVLSALLLVFLAVPSLFIIPVAFSEANFLSWPPQGFSLKWFEAVLTDPSWISALGNSLIAALLSATLGLLTGVPAAFALARKDFKAKPIVFGLLMAPVVVPNIFIAVGLFYIFSRIGLAGSVVGLALGHTVLAIPYVLVVVMAIVRGYDQHLDYAAYTMGATRMQTIKHITIPLIRPGLISAFMFAFIVSFDELTIALFLTGGTMTTVPKKMWDGAALQVSPELAAASALLFAFIMILVLVAEVVRTRHRQS